MKAPISKVLSARVPVDVMTTIDELCSKQGVSRSQWLTTVVSEQKTSDFYKDGGVIQSRMIPKEMQDILVTAGVATVGILSFNLVNKALLKAVDENGKPKFSEGEVAFISTVTALAIAMTGFGIVKSLVNE